MAHLAMAFLGAFRVTLDGQPITRFGTDKTRALLAYLALESEHAHRRETLAAMLWPNQPDRATRHSLRQALLRLCNALVSHAFFCATPETLAFDRTSDYSLDVDEFSAHIQRCSQHAHVTLHDCPVCITQLQQAVALYRGALLSDLFIGESALFEEWVLLRREVLHRQMLDALDALTACFLRRGEYARARGYAVRQIELEPWHEEAHRALMTAWALEGQRGAALAQYDVCRKILAREFNTIPSEETVTLAENIRAGCLVAGAASRAAPREPSDVDTLAALAQYHLAQGDWARAYAYQTQVLAQRKTLGDKSACAAARYQLGVILQRQRKWSAALAQFRAALALREQIGDRAGVAALLDAMGQIWAQKGNHAEARAHFRRALKILAMLGDPVGQACVLTRLGTLAQHQAQFTEARMYLARALTFQMKLGNRAAIAELRAQLAACRAAN